jgi:flavodoxin I
MTRDKVSAKIGLFYCSTTGQTDTIAELIRNEFGSEMVNLHCVAEASKKDFVDYKYLIIGSPTWGIGKLQIDWEEFLPELDDIDFRGKKVAYFGLGDQIKYPYNFLDAMGILAMKITSLGGTRIGSWSTEGYDFRESQALVNTQSSQYTNGIPVLLQDQFIQQKNHIENQQSQVREFVGLAIDEDNQPELTEERIKIWVTQIRQAMEV